MLNEVHRLIEEKRYRFGMTGSSARKLKQKGVNLLAGRAIVYIMHPLIIQELAGDFSLEHALQYGLLPMTFIPDQDLSTRQFLNSEGQARQNQNFLNDESHSQSAMSEEERKFDKAAGAHRLQKLSCTEDQDPKAYLSSYVTTYLREEVMQEGLTRQLDSFSRALEAASFSQGSPLNVSAVAREAQVSRKVMDGYFSIMEDLLLAKKIPIFTKRAKRKLINHSKFYFFDVGIYRTLRPMGPFDRTEEIEGAALETLFLSICER